MKQKRAFIQNETGIKLKLKKEVMEILLEIAEV
jgi:hypothetical protein